ncbi:TPA: hypothetical protein QDB24_006009 [Burkholderia vietnamiensis]|uniref:hypothetical protein n=1 Tax=Burkholderia vietnamiensis TaxID=60552 RepID=UPI001B8E23E5|nr:hypothetical protein [Burkholderia vietnamiensis]MBR7913640.1 hypothetical protein [Burkholderia vietnamiensis]HDR9277849.1 hypothetical protein [Burkholderia vietnamiensis]
MLRALVREGVTRIAAARRELYAVQFHGWRVRVRQHDGAMLIDLRSREGDVWRGSLGGVCVMQAMSSCDGHLTETDAMM